MKRIGKATIWAAVMVFAFISAPFIIAAVDAPTLTPDKADYKPEELVTITGEGFEPNTVYDMPVIRPDGTIVFGDGSFLRGWDSVQSDAEGGFTYEYQLDGIVGSNLVLAYDHQP